jgi:hypothetical protein
MFTTGSKLFLGATVVSIVATIVYGVSTGGTAGITGTVGLVSVSAALAFLTGLNFFIRDGNVPGLDPAATTSAPAARGPVTRSWWPLIGAGGVGLLMVGAVSEPVVFKAGVVVLVASIVEWMVQAWSERASGDATYNARVRRRILHPLELPLLGAVIIAVIVYSFSRIMLWLSETDGPVAFGIVATLVLVGGFLFAYKPGLKKGAIVAIATIAGLGLVSTGAVMAIDGQRHIEPEHTFTSDRNQGICDSAEELPADEDGSQSVAMKANLAATLILEADGTLRAKELETGTADGPFLVARSTVTNIVFKNDSDEHRRLTLALGEFTENVNGSEVKHQPKMCTTLVKPGGVAFMTFSIPKPSVATPVPYEFTVPGVDSASVPVVVP